MSCYENNFRRENMSKSFSESYKEAGVDITAGYKSVELMKST